MISCAINLSNSQDSSYHTWNSGNENYSARGKYIENKKFL